MIKNFCKRFFFKGYYSGIAGIINKNVFFERSLKVKEIKKKVGIEKKEILKEEKKKKEEIIRFSINEIDDKMINSDDLESLLIVFNEKKNYFTINNYMTFLNESIRKQKEKKFKEKKDTDINNNLIYVQSLLKIDEIKFVLEFLKEKSNEFDGLQTSTFLTILSKFEYYEKTLIEKLSNNILKNKLKCNLKSYSYILWSLAHFKIRNEELIDFIVINLLKMKKFELKSQVNIIWSLSELNYKNEALTKKIEELILKNACNYDLPSINLIFGSYNNTRNPNIRILDELSIGFIKHSKSLSFRNVANLLNYCANLNYVNYNLFSHLESILIKHLREQEKNADIRSEQIISENSEETNLEQLEKNEENKENNIINKEIENSEFLDEITPFEASQILASFCKLKIVKPDLFQLLEASFIRMLYIANPSSFVAFSFAHSQLCTELSMKLHENKKIMLKRSLKNLKKYNQTFYELSLPFIKEKIKEFKFEQIYSILLSASRPLVKKRVICRDLIEIGIESIKLIPNSQIDKEKVEQLMFQHFKTLMQFVFKDEQKKMIENIFEEKKIDLKKLCIKHGYLVPISPDSL